MYCNCEEYTSCPTGHQHGDHELPTITCTHQPGHTSHKPRRMPSTANHDTSLPCQSCARRQKCQQTLTEQKAALDAHKTSMLRVTRRRANLTPLFWDTERCRFDDTWSKEDPTLGAYTYGGTVGLLNSLVRQRESRFKELWTKAT